VVKPLTRQSECSYVEFASISPELQVPRWFVSHYWGEPIESFMACLELFHDRHALQGNTPFWICAYALRQHQLDKEIGRGDPTQEAFAKAIKSESVQGTVTILDEKLEAYKRAWCCFEATVTIGIGKRLDLVVSQTSSTGKRRTYMIADGPAGACGDKAEALDTAFPQKVAEEGMRVEVELSTASDPNDRNRILNCIAHETVSLKVPPLHHPMYDHYNEMLRKKFAAIVLRVATANGDADGVRRALHRSPTSPMIQNGYGKSQLEVAREFAFKYQTDDARQDIVAYIEEASNNAPNPAPAALERSSTIEQAFSETESECSTISVITRMPSDAPFAAGPQAHLPHSRRKSVGLLQLPGVHFQAGLLPEDEESDAPATNSQGLSVQLPAYALRHRNSTCSMVSNASSALARFLDSHNSSKRSTLIPVAQQALLSRRPSHVSTVSSQVALPFMHQLSNATVSSNQGALSVVPSLMEGPTQQGMRMSSPSGYGLTEGPAQQGRRKSRCHSEPPADLVEMRNARRPSIRNLSTATLTSKTQVQGTRPGLNQHAKQLNDAPSATSDEVARIIEDVQTTNGSPHTLEEALRKLGALAAVNACFQHKACTAGAVKAVLAGMKDPHSEVGVQREACHALWSLIFNSKQLAEEAINQGAKGAVKMALQRYPEDSRLLMEGRRVLGEMLLAEEILAAKEEEMQVLPQQVALVPAAPSLERLVSTRTSQTSECASNCSAPSKAEDEEALTPAELS